MNRRPRQKLSLTMMIFLMSVFVLMSLVSCGPRLKGIRVLSDKPVGNTFHSAYPTIKEIYKSDDEIYLVSTWRSSGSSEGHRIRWEIWTPEGESIYTTSKKNVTIHPHMSNFQHVQLDKDVKEKLRSGMYTIKLYFDDQLIKSQEVAYINKSIINANLNGAVILPFSFEGPGQLKHKPYVNTITNAICCEVKRIVKETVPPAVAEDKIGATFSPEYLNDPSRMSSVRKVFSEDILITGKLIFSDLVSDPNLLIIYVYNSKTGATKKFMHIESGGKQYYSLILTDLIESVLYETDFLEYLRSF